MTARKESNNGRKFPDTVSTRLKSLDDRPIKFDAEAGTRRNVDIPIHHLHGRYEQRGTEWGVLHRPLDRLLHRLVGEEVKRSRSQNPSAEAMGHAPRSFSCRRLRHSLPGTDPSHVRGIRQNDVETPVSNEAQAFPEPAWTLARDADRTPRAELCPSRNRLVRHWRFQPVEIELGKCPRALERRRQVPAQSDV